MSIFMGAGRPRPADYLAITRSIADTYPYGVPHGVQKDAIQNGMDARVGRQRLKFRFELIRNEKGRFLTMTDENTTGLTGPVLHGEDYLEDLPEDARWARFESFGFMNPDPDALGARGQGKFIFLAASKQSAMLYETLYRDGVYRVGGTEARRTGCPMFPGPGEDPWEGERGREILRSKTGLAPLTRQGTRIIIVNPTDEVVQSIRNGTFAKAIEETWFRSIEKNKAEIVLVEDGQRIEAQLPDPFPIPDRDTDSTKTWILGKDTHDRSIRIGQDSYRVKRLKIAYNERELVPEEHRGIAIIHNGMKICCLSGAGDVPTPAVMRLFPLAIRRHVYGFIEFDRDLDRELRRGENQKPNHYELDWRRALPRAIKAYVERQCTEFGNRKLGLGVDPRERRRRAREAAEEWALRELGRHARDLDLFSGRGISRPPPPPPPSLARPLGVRIHNFNFPVPERRPRVNWGESIGGFALVPFNNTNEAFAGYLSGFILYGDTRCHQIVDSEAVTMKCHESLEGLGPYEILFSKEDFPEKGLYRLRAILYDEDGNRIDEQTRRMYLECDPPFRSPFEVQAADFSEFGEEYKDQQWIEQGQIGNDPLLLYNVKHPAYERYEDDTEFQGEYLFEIFLEGAMAFVLGRPLKPDGTEDFHPLSEENIRADPLSAYRELIGKIAEIRRRFYSGR